jgi:hypothetical protein
MARDYKCITARYLRRGKRQTGNGYGAPSYGAPECEPNYDDLRYGFRSRVSLVENQSCMLGVTCTATGDKIDVVGGINRNFIAANSFGLTERQTGEEFSSDAPPECRAIRDPSESCRGY